LGLALLLEGVVEVETGVNTPKGAALLVIYVSKLLELLFLTHVVVEVLILNDAVVLFCGLKRIG